MSEQETTRHRHQSEPGRAHTIWTNYKVELIGLVLAGLGLFLLLEQLNLRRSAAVWSRAAISALLNRFRSLDSEVTVLLTRISLSDVLGVLLIVVALVAILSRLRWRLLNASRLTASNCPRCGGNIQRVHRKWYDRLINAYVPVRRYRCVNSACRWKGLRVGRSQGLSRHRPANRPA